METVLLVIHMLIALAMIILVLLQRSEGGGLGIGGGSGGIGNVASPRGTANVLTRATAICFVLFVLTSLTLSILASRGNKDQSLLQQLDSVETQSPAPPVSGAADPAAAPPASPADTAPAGQVPISQ